MGAGDSVSTYPKAIQHPVGNVPHTSWATGKPTAVLNHFTVSCGSLWPGAGRFNIDGIGPQFGIRRDGTVCQYVDPATIATWHAFDESKHAVGIEWEASPPSCPITVEQLRAGAELNAWLCTTFGIPPIRCPGIAFGPGIKVHTDGLEDGGKAWDPNGHWDGIWKATGDDIAAWASPPQRAALDTSPWTSELFVAAVAAIVNPPKEDDLTDAQAAMLDNLDFTAKREALHHGLSLAPGSPWRENLAKIRAAAARKTLGVPDGQKTPVPPTVP